MDCQHLELKKTTATNGEGVPLYECAAKCGAGLFTVKPTEIVMQRGRVRPAQSENGLLDSVIDAVRRYKNKPDEYLVGEIKAIFAAADK
jgi:hypothetical protein